MKIRQMKLSDIPTILTIGRNTEGFRVDESSDHCFWSEDQLKRWVASDDVNLVAECDNRVVGFVLTAHHRPTGKVTWENQVVLPEYRGRGIGQALVTEMEKYLKAEGAVYLHALTKTNNPHLSHYEKLLETGETFVWLGKFL